MNKTVTTEINSIDNHSAEISANAKGQITYTVKAYGATPKLAKDRAVKMFRELKQDLEIKSEECDSSRSSVPQTSGT
jgi:uncharacterized protein YjhX (UPF0386 family)